MLRCGNTATQRCGFYARRLLVLVFLGYTQAEAAQPLNTAIARQAYSQAERWVADAKAPANTPLQGLMMVTDLSAVHATIRLDGVMLGHASVVVTQPGEQAPTETDLMVPVIQAVREALKASAGSMERRALEDAKARLCLDLQFAFPPEKLRLANLQGLPAQITPGRDGLAMSFNKRGAFLFPGNIIASNIKIMNQVTRLLGGLGLPVDHVGRIGQPGGPELYRFQAIHLVKPRAGQPVIELTRGTRRLLRRLVQSDHVPVFATDRFAVRNGDRELRSSACLVPADGPPRGSRPGAAGGANGCPGDAGDPRGV
jgi:hypothetical protein